MFSNPLEVVSRLMGNTKLNVDLNQCNRHCILLNGQSEKHAFYFSTPIYNESSRKLVRCYFSKKNNSYYFVGSSSTVQVFQDHAKIVNKEKEITIHFKKNVMFHQQNGYLISKELTLYPTYNGIQIRGKIAFLNILDFSINFKYQKIKKSPSSMCFMESKFKPILVVSAMALEKQNKLNPLLLDYQNKNCFLNGSMFACKSLLDEIGIVEINFYEKKILQDTPVSSHLSKWNDAFGPIAFIGKSSSYGMQWLYSRIDLSKMPELSQKVISQVKLFFPQHRASDVELEVFVLPKRFCSFGSNWDNKVSRIDLLEKASMYNDFVCVDLTKNCVQRGQLNESYGFVMCPREHDTNESHIISTGDCYSSPPILYVRYKK